MNTALRQKLTSGHPVFVTFTKRDGSTRQISARYDGATSRSLDQVVVTDLTINKPRTITLSRVHTVFRASDRPVQRPASPPAPKPTSYAEAKAAIDELFY